MEKGEMVAESLTSGRIILTINPNTKEYSANIQSLPLGAAIAALKDLANSLENPKMGGLQGIKFYDDNGEKVNPSDIEKANHDS